MKSQRLTTGQIAELIAIDGEFARAGTGGIRAQVQGLIAILTKIYFIPVADEHVSEKHQAKLAKYRKIASEHPQPVPMTAPLCYQVRAGYTLKTHAPKTGPCRKNFQYLWDWNFPDEGTEDCLAFWVPRILTYSTSKTKDQQLQLLANLQTKLELPVHHMSGFGKASLVAGLILAHFKVTGERIPLNKDLVRTDTCLTNGRRICLGEFGQHGLDCCHWCFDDVAGDPLGVFALGLEALG